MPSNTEHKMDVLSLVTFFFHNGVPSSRANDVFYPQLILIEIYYYLLFNYVTNSDVFGHPVGESNSL